ncbi:hypothetical protein CK203_097230 [Vitis vinifera]|uniref:Uncharacterized protein n=1 Tax=Vitis vinifera TaxID=29760 RepID=A0A438DJ04_VITVI|nr:hypothetical protein CK203_097230 [Vitis vinifera]
MGGSMGRKEHKQPEWGGGKLALDRSYAKVVKRQKYRDKNLVRMEVRKEEIQNNLRKLEHCIIGSWDPSSEGGEDLETLGHSLAKIWGLKGNLGMARLEENKILLEFGLMEEANRLPLSLWNPKILRRVGEECGGFIAMDPRTEKLQELQWARILVRTEGEDLPRVMEIAVEEKVYTLALWWELKPALRKAQENRHEEYERTRGEVRVMGVTRWHASGEREGNARLEELFLSEEKTGDKEGELAGS